LSISDISVVIMAKNAEETIEECLDALKDFSEIIFYLNNSTDTTEELALYYPNVKIVKGDFLGFGKTKNKAASYSKNDWILSLDSDEVLNKVLIEEIEQLDLKEKTKIVRLKRDNYFLGYKTQTQDTITRLYHKKYTEFNDNTVHEKVMIPNGSEVVTLQHSFKHLNITNINQTLTKIIKYTDLGAENKKMCFFSVVIAKALFGFFKTYFIQGNIFRGWVGFALAINTANKRYYKYIKQFINCKEKKSKTS